jgi:glycosyltransferase involved in cell wall biosynthesis
MVEISVIVPNYNKERFLRERFDTILNQTFKDFEVIVVDSSDDSSLKIINEYKKKDKRIKLYRTPKEGIYQAWNLGIKRAKGKFIYIATSDDTMEKNCLEEMHTALTKNTDCGFCSCLLKFIDFRGVETKKKYPMQKFLTPEVSKAPRYGFLHFAQGAVFTSITQLLIRKKVFDKIGLFSYDFGSKSDFEWEMRASLVFDVYYVPKKLATWRIYSGQETTKTEFEELIKMCKKAIEKTKININLEDYLFVYNKLARLKKQGRKCPFLRILRFLSRKTQEFFLFDPDEWRVNYLESIMDSSRGVNLVGYLRGEFGIAQGSKYILDALEKHNFPVSLINVDSINHKNVDCCYSNFKEDAIYPINIIGLNFTNEQFLRRKWLDNRYNIGIIAWEMENFPLRYLPRLIKYNEIWVHSELSKRSLEKVVDIPVVVVPCPIYIEKKLLVRDKKSLMSI